MNEKANKKRVGRGEMRWIYIICGLRRKMVFCISDWKQGGRGKGEEEEEE